MPSWNYHVTHFVTSAPDIRHLPDDTGVEVAFAGRSNAGKSSALNTLTQQKSLARTSKTPGRTQLINLFEVAEGARHAALIASCRQHAKGPVHAGPFSLPAGPLTRLSL